MKKYSFDYLQLTALISEGGMDMIISQKRVRGLSKLNNLENGTSIRVVVRAFAPADGTKMGFNPELTVGQCVLPAVCGPASRFNANGKFIIHKDREKEEKYRMVEWTYKQWKGRDDFTEVTESKAVRYLRYPRTLIEPPSIEFTIADLAGDAAISSPGFIVGVDDDKIIVAINVLLEFFGTCEILTSDMTPFLRPAIIKLNWDVLPKGNFPWGTQKTRIEPFLQKAKGANRKVIEKRHETINEKEPDFTAIGKGGFSGYVIHGFEDRELYVLESVEVNNATYIVRSEWEAISQLTKAEILRDDLYEYRVIHNEKWYEAIRGILG